MPAPFLRFLSVLFLAAGFLFLASAFAVPADFLGRVFVAGLVFVVSVVFWDRADKREKEAARGGE